MKLHDFIQFYVNSRHFLVSVENRNLLRASKIERNFAFNVYFEFNFKDCDALLLSLSVEVAFSQIVPAFLNLEKYLSVKPIEIHPLLTTSLV